MVFVMEGVIILWEGVNLIWRCTVMYRLHHKVQVSMRFTYRRLEAWGCVNCVETEPSDITDLYRGLRGHDNGSMAYQLVSAIKGLSAYLATVQTIVIDRVDTRYHEQWADAIFNSSFLLDVQNHNTIVSVYKRSAMQSLCWFQLVVVRASAATTTYLNCWLGNHSLHPYN